MKKKGNLSIAEIATLIGISTTSLVQVVPVIDTHPIGGSILASAIITATICWAIKKRG